MLAPADFGPPIRTKYRGPMAARSRPWLAAWRIFLLAATTLLLYSLMRVIQLLSRRARRLELAARWDHRWGRWARRALGFRLTARGPLPPPGALLTPNHTGYMDIFAFNALVPCFFVPKADISAWPVAGRLVRGAGHVFIERANKRALMQ